MSGHKSSAPRIRIARSADDSNTKINCDQNIAIFHSPIDWQMTKTNEPINTESTLSPCRNHTLYIL